MKLRHRDVSSAMQLYMAKTWQSWLGFEQKLSVSKGEALT